MGLIELILTSIGGLGISGLLLYAGTRYTAKKSNEVGTTLAAIEARKVNIDEFRAITERYDTDLEQVRQELLSSRRDLDNCRALLRSSILYISSLRKTLRDNRIYPDPLPQVLDPYYTFWDTAGDYSTSDPNPRREEDT